MKKENNEHHKSIFDVSYSEIAKRQFFAGFMAGLGGVAATLISGFILSIIVVKIVAPQLNTILIQMRTTLEGAGFAVNPSTPNPTMKNNK
jgi:hypothetical protein